MPFSAIVQDRSQQFSPRLGFAYRPLGGGSTVIRGGYGVYFDMMPIDLQASTVAIRVPGDDLHESVSAYRRPSRRVSGGRNVGAGDDRAAARGQSRPPASVQPSVECDD